MKVDVAAIAAEVMKELKRNAMIEVEASGRHLHLCREDVELLFGKNYQLTKVRDLSQPGQFVCKERVSISGSKGTLENVVILGPERKETQAEISLTDALAIGEKAPVRLSGEIEGSPPFLIQNGEKQIKKEQGLIVAKRHLHIKPEDAKRLQVQDKEVLKIKVFGTRPVIFEDTIVRISEDFETYFHIDYDEANACGFQKGMFCKIIKDKKENQPEADCCKPVGGVLNLTSCKVLRESDFCKAKRNHCGTVLIDHKAILTPLAKDFIANQNIEIKRQ